MTPFAATPSAPWRLATARVVRAARSVPFTVTLIALLFGTTIALHQLGSDDGIVRWASTNVQNLTHRPIVSFVASALVLVDARWPLTMATLAVGVGLLESRVGTARAFGVFASGHVIATIVTEATVRLDIHLGHLRASAATQLDAGVSYGMWAVGGAALALLPSRWRWPAVAGLVASVATPLVHDFDMTASGHAVAFLVGLAWWRWLPISPTRSATRPAQLDHARLMPRPGSGRTPAAPAR